MSALPHPQQTVDTRDMVCVHLFLRREFRLAGGVIRAVPGGDVARAAGVADHLAFLGDFLHRHHTSEDRLLWPLLLDRVPDELAPIVHLMESQHARVDGLLAQIAGSLPAWRADANQPTRDQLADLFDTLYVNLSEHLDAEEQRLLPLAARSVSAAEWAELGEEGARETPRSQRALVLGMFLYEGDPGVVDQMLSGVPAPFRRVLPLLARRAFRQHALAIHGTATP